MLFGTTQPRDSESLMSTWLTTVTLFGIMGLKENAKVKLHQEMFSYDKYIDTCLTPCDTCLRLMCKILNENKTSNLKHGLFSGEKFSVLNVNLQSLWSVTTLSWATCMLSNFLAHYAAILQNALH